MNDEDRVREHGRNYRGGSRRGGPSLIGSGEERPYRGRGSGRNSGPTRRRKTTLAEDWLNVRTRKKSLWDEEIICEFGSKPPLKKEVYNPYREWFSRNIGELLLGLGWARIEEKTIWAKPDEATPVSWRSYFYSEFPIAYSYNAERYHFDVARVYQARIEMPLCKKAHRVAVLDLACENRLERFPRDRPFELLSEKFCECYYDGRRAHEGSLYIYRWR
jgi:hypothetical protein